ncbi:MAG TPA: hypothetical protein VII63_12405 [Caulobacteraceae bacterium]
MAPVALQILFIVLAAANALFLWRALAQPWLALACIVVVAASGGLVFSKRERWSEVEWRWAAICAVLALAISVLGGAGHLMFTAEDWVARDSVLSDVARWRWPVTYDWHGVRWALRAPLGFYMLPGLAGAWLGLSVAHAAVLVQNTLILTAVLLLYLRGAQGWRWRVITLAVFVLFSGWDIVGEIKVWSLAQAAGHSIPFPLHIERWAGDMEYSSFLTDIFWAPNHGLPAFAFVGAYLCWRRREISATALTVFAGLCVFWSPLAVMGMAPFILLAAVTDLRRGRVRLRDLGFVLAVGLALLPVLLYLRLGSASVVHGFAFQLLRGFWPRYGLFLTVEVVPIVYLMWRGGGRTRGSRVEMAMITGMLVLIPLYLIGWNNDFMMRASIPPLVLAALIIADRLEANLQRRDWTSAALAIVVLAVGAVTPALQIVRSFYYPATPPMTTDVPQVWERYSRTPPDTYLVPADMLGQLSPLFRTDSGSLRRRRPGAA